MVSQAIEFLNAYICWYWDSNNKKKHYLRGKNILNSDTALHLLDEAIATPFQPLHTASSLLRAADTPPPLRQQPVSALRHSACMYTL